MKIPSLVLAGTGLDLDCKVTDLQIEGTSLSVLNLVSVEETIDQIFDVLESQRRPELLEDLCPYFGAIWPAGLGLAQYVMRQVPLNERILELGCGLSLPGLALAKKGYAVTLSDYHPDVPEFLRRNLEFNQIPSARVEFCAMDWRTTEAKLDDFATVLASDVLYDRAQAAELIHFLGRFRNLRRLIVADPGRPFLQTFQSELTAKFNLMPKISIERCQSLHQGQEIWILDACY